MTAQILIYNNSDTKTIVIKTNIISLLKEEDKMFEIIIGGSGSGKSTLFVN